MKYPGHLFLQELILQPTGEWDIRREVWMFLRVVSGEASWIDDRSSFLLRTDEMLLVPPTRHGTLRASQLSALTTVYFQFCPDLLGGLLTVQERLRAGRTAGARALSRVFGVNHEAAQEFKTISGFSLDVNGPITRSRLLHMALMVLLQSSPATSVRDTAFLPASKRADVLLRKISEAELLDFCAEDFAAHCGCSVRHVNKLLRGLLGMSLRAKQREIRLFNARHLLIETAVSIEEVARASGFREQKSFSVEFKSQFGVTPTEWRAHRDEGVMKNGHAEGHPPAS